MYVSWKSNMIIHPQFLDIFSDIECVFITVRFIVIPPQQSHTILGNNSQPYAIQSYSSLASYNASNALIGRHRLLENKRQRPRTRHGPV